MTEIFRYSELHNISPDRKKPQNCGKASVLRLLRGGYKYF